VFRRIDHVEIIPKDIEETLAFYTDILGFKIKERNKFNRPAGPPPAGTAPVPSGPPAMTEIVYVTLGDTMIEFLAFSNPGPSPEGHYVGYRMLALEVEDMDKTVDYLKSKGVPTTRGPNTMGKTKRAEIKDPRSLSSNSG
jgi:glyoxylase I family protein